MDDLVSNFYTLDGHSVEAYESSHKPRLDFLVTDLGLDKIENSKIADFGCGYGPIFRRLPKDKGNTFFGFDGDSARLAANICNYTQIDLNRCDPTTMDGDPANLDVALCFETLEHLTNPYACLIFIKDFLKKDGLLYLSVPHEDCTHNTIYPGLLYPVSNFKEFLGQMAFEIEDHRIHDKAFKQHVFTLRNKTWAFSKMKWVKNEDKFRNISPAKAVNL